MSAGRDGALRRPQTVDLFETCRTRQRHAPTKNACQTSPCSPASAVMEEPAKSKKPLVVVIVLLLIFAGAYFFVLNAYKNEGNNRAAELTADTAKAGENRIEVSGRLVTADPLKGDVVVRLEFTPHGSLASGDGGALARDLDLSVSSATGKNVHEFKKGKRMNPVEAVVEIYEGEPMDYPFDSHAAELSFFFEPSAGKGGEPAAAEPIPLAVQMHGAV